MKPLHFSFFRLVALPFFCICFLSGCDQITAPEPAPIDSQIPALPVLQESKIMIPDGNYMLKTLDSRPYQGPAVTLNIKANRISGKAPVNQYHGILTNGKTGPIATTMMAGPPEAMELETLFFKQMEEALLEVTSDNTLTVRKKGIARLIFESVSSSEATQQ